MNCHRCNGLMVVDHFIDMEGMGSLWMRGWRCMNCGEVEDPEIYRHRLMQSSLRGRLASVFSRKRGRRSRDMVRLSA